MLGYSSFFAECCKFHEQFGEAIKNPRNVFSSWDKSVWSCCQKICILRREYLSSGLNVLTNSLKISNVTKADFFQLNLSRIHGKIEKYWCGANFGSVSNPLTRWFRKSALKQDLLDGLVNFSFRCDNFSNNKARILFFFFQNVLNFMDISEMQ